MTALQRAARWFVAPAEAEPQAGTEPDRGQSRDHWPAPSEPPAVDPPAGAWLPPASGVHPGNAAITCAAVLGRPGEAEPVAAALALALRRRQRKRAATVAISGAPRLEPSGGGSGPARRLVAALDAHGLSATARGRLACVSLPDAESQAVAAARRAALVAPPVVVAITAPRSPPWDELLAGQDLIVIVSLEPEGPLAQLAAATLPRVRTRVTAPLGRGPARALARAGLLPARSITALLTPREDEP